MIKGQYTTFVVRVSTLFSLLALIAISGCKGEAEREIEANDWVSTPSPEAVTTWKWDQIPENVVFILEKNKEKYLEMLEREEVVELDKKMIPELGPGTKKIPKNLTAYVTRAVYPGDVPGHIEVLSHDTNLWVRFGFLGKTPGKLSKFPVVVFLPKRPTKVFVDGSWVE